MYSNQSKKTASRDAFFPPKSVCLKNLPPTATENSIKELFRSHLNPRFCEVTFKKPSPGYTTPPAFVNVGNYENVKKAIRNLNGIMVDGNCVYVAVKMFSFKSPPHNKVYLSEFPCAYTNADAYDLVSPYGDILSMDITFDRNAENRQLFSACATFSTQEQAERALRELTSRRDKGDSIPLAVPDKNLEFYKPVPRLLQDVIWLDSVEDGYFVHVV